MLSDQNELPLPELIGLVKLIGLIELIGWTGLIGLIELIGSSWVGRIARGASRCRDSVNSSSFHAPATKTRATVNMFPFGSVMSVPS